MMLMIKKIFFRASGAVEVFELMSPIHCNCIERLDLMRFLSQLIVVV